MTNYPQNLAKLTARTPASLGCSATSNGEGGCRQDCPHLRSPMPPTLGHCYAKYTLTTVTHRFACDAECCCCWFANQLASQSAWQLRGVAKHLVCIVQSKICVVQRISTSAPQAAVLGERS